MYSHAWATVCACLTGWSWRKLMFTLMNCSERKEGMNRNTDRVLSTGGGARVKILPQTLQLPPQNFCQLNLTKSYSVLAKNLSAIPQLLGPQNCLRMPQNHSQKAQNSKNSGGGGGMPQTPLENCGLWVQPPSTITFNIFPPPQGKNPRQLHSTGLYAAQE